MATVSTYLNFDGTCEEAFAFYKDVFGGEYVAPPQKMRDVPRPPEAPPLSDDEGNRIMHVALATVGGHQIMGTDIMPSMGHTLTTGNAMSINLELDDEETLREIHEKLSEGAAESYGPQAEFWGQLFATCADRYGIRWMMVSPLDEGTGLA
ncbi:VOC family protein [Demequina soli]|uniref:VOC family protein n=1 Tax=Demequina soli TaxID=1638987 RepID=UPI00078512BC|nr:VOC family protein [Demequina soli]